MGASIRGDALAVYATPAPVVVTAYHIVQAPGGTGLVLVFFDATALPADNRDWFTATPGDAQPVFSVPLQAGQSFHLALPAPWHRYSNGLAALISTSFTKLIRASASTFFAVKYAPDHVG